MEGETTYFFAGSCCGKKKVRNTKRLLWLLLALGVLLGTLADAVAASDGSAEGADYLIKYKTPPDEEPFHVVGAAELERLLEKDALLWYEPDAELPLDDLLPPEAESPKRSAQDRWATDMIGASAAVEAGFIGQGVRVGVIDSGVASHADLLDNLAAGGNYIEGATDPSDTSDSYGHGTRVAGLIAGHGETSSTGAAPGATIVPLKCTDGKTVKVSAICRAVYGGVDDFDCEILNMSLGLTTDYEALKEAVAYAQANGVLVVAAAGNGGGTAVYYPAGYEGALGVGAVDRDGVVFNNSNRNQTVFLTAPGVSVPTLHPLGGYTTATGTSFAVPLVSASAAVLMSAAPSLTAEEISALLRDGALDAGVEGWDSSYGCGIVNLENSLACLRKDDPPAPPEPSVFALVSTCEQGAECPLYRFADLHPNAWYHDGVHFVLHTGWMAGIAEQRFDPDGITTRAMLVTTLYRAEGEPESQSEAPSFPDVISERYYTNAVLWAAETQIITGYPDGSFRPDEPITREETMTMLCRYAAWKGAPASQEGELPDFPDADQAADYAQDALRWAVRAEILRGTTAPDGQTLLAPKAAATRAQLAAMLLRLCKLLRNQ